MAPPDSSKDSGKDSHQQVSEKVTSRALAMAFGTLSSRILGLIREIVFAAYFDRSLTDAWTAAFRVPNLLRRLLGEGSLSVSFIPVFIEAREDDPARAKNLVNSLYSFLLVVVTTLTGVGILLTEPLLRLLLSPEFIAVPGKFELTVHMARIMFGFVFLITHYAFFMGLLNALGRFALPALAPTLFNVAMISATLLSSFGWVPARDGLAWGVLCGGLLQAGILLPALRRAGYWPRWWPSWRSADLQRVLRNMVPGLVGTGLLQLMTLVNLRFASSLPQGAVSYVYWADRLLELPLSLVAVSLGAALLPELAQLSSRQQKASMAATTNFYLRLNLYMALPAAVGLFMLAKPLVEVLFLRGHFGAADLANTAAVLKLDAILLIFLSCIRVLLPSYYALKNTWLPAVISVLALVLHLCLAPILMTHWGLQGLVASTCLSAAANLLGLAGCYPKWVGEFDLWLLFRQIGKFAVAAALMALVLLAYDPIRDVFGSFTALAIMIFLALLVYGFASAVLKLEEFQSLWRRLHK